MSEREARDARLLRGEWTGVEIRDLVYEAREMREALEGLLHASRQYGTPAMEAARIAACRALAGEVSR